MTAYIYESPDGETIYRREPGNPTRELYHVSDKQKNLHAELKHSQLWGNIHRAAQTDLVLKQMLKQIEVYHALKNTLP